MNLTTLRTDIRYLISPQLTSVDYPDVDLDRNLNRNYQTVLGWIVSKQGDWEISADIIYRDRTAQVSDFEIPSRLIRIYKGEVMNANGGEFVPLSFESVQMNQKQVEGNATRTYDDTQNPTAELFGDFIQIRPVTTETVVNGIKLWVQLDFVSLANANDVPDLMEPVQRVLSYLTALDYAIAEDLDKKITNLNKLIFGDPSKKDDPGMKGLIEELYANRSGARRDRLVTKRTRFN